MTFIPSASSRIAWRSSSGPAFSEPTSARIATGSRQFAFPVSDQKIWVPSLYMGGLALILAVSAIRFRRGAVRQIWLSIILVMSVVASLGQYTSPIWAARVLEQTYEKKLADIGRLDKLTDTPIRGDGYLRDGDGSIYWWLTTVLPGFRQFRFPAKLFTFTTFGLAALGGIGWDSLRPRRIRGPLALASFILAITLGLLAVVLGERQTILNALSSVAGKIPASSFGPVDAVGGYYDLVRGLAHAAVVLTLALFLFFLAVRRPACAGLIVLVVASFDLAVANARYVGTVPQALFDEVPEAVGAIREAEPQNPSPGPFRVHRMPTWNPARWFSTSLTDRVREFVTWERATIQPKYGITEGIEYTHTIGVAELFDYEWFFSGFPFRIRETPGSRDRHRSEAWRSGGLLPQARVSTSGIAGTSSSRFTLAVGWTKTGAMRHSWKTRIWSIPCCFRNAAEKPRRKSGLKPTTTRSARNRQAYPRAWVVHDSRPLPALENLTKLEQGGPMQEILYNDDGIWHDSTLTAFDPHRLAWIEQDTRLELRPFLSGKAPLAGETVKVSYPSPQRVELEVKLDSPGIVVLADVYYPGWKLTIDDQPAPIYKVNRLMRGAAVGAGSHRLAYTYEPGSFQIGGIFTLAGLAALVLLTIYFRVRPGGQRSASAGFESAGDVQ